MKNFDHLKLPPTGKTSNRFTKEAAISAQKFHQTLPGYSVTRLVQVPTLAKVLGVKNILIKDEASRFGLNSFKGLGGSYCLFRLLSEKYGWSGKVKSFQHLKELIALFGDKPKVISATDGNHGRGLAWICGLLGLKCEILMPSGSCEERLENIRKLGAECRRTDGNYDETVHTAERLAQENGWLLIQDTALPGFEKAAHYIMQGYLTMALETVEQVHGKRPTHIFLQAGVGSMAGAMCGFLPLFTAPTVLLFPLSSQKQPIVFIGRQKKMTVNFIILRAAWRPSWPDFPAENLAASDGRRSVQPRHIISESMNQSLRQVFVFSPLP